MAKNKKTSTAKRTMTKGNKLLAAVMVFLGLIFIGNLFGLASELSRRYRSGYELSTFMSEFGNSDYVRLKTMAVGNRAKGYETLHDTAEYEVFADYYYASLLAEGYDALGISAERDKYYAVAEKNFSKLTHYGLIQRGNVLNEKHGMKK